MDDGKNFWKQEGGDANFFKMLHERLSFFTDIIDKPLMS